MTKPYQKKYRPNQPEDLHSNGRVNRLAFVSRIVNTENKPLSVKEAWSLTNKRDAKDIGLNQTRFGAALSAAVRGGRIDKTRIQETPTKYVVKYHPVDMKPMGLDIPVPFYTRDTKDNPYFPDDDDVFTFDDDEEQEGDKPDAVKVAEQVIADIAGLPADGPTVSDIPPHAMPPHARHSPIDEDVFNTLAEKHKSEGLFRIKHNKDAVKDFDPQKLVDAFTEQRDAVVSTIQHHFTAEQLLDTLNNINPDLHDDVLVAVYEALGKTVYIISTARKTACMKWAFVNGNLVVKE